MNALRITGLLIATLVFVGDQVAKYIIIVPLGLRDLGQVELLPFFNLTWVENYGVSMGFLNAETPQGRWMLIALTAAIAVGVLVWMWRERSRPDVIALGMILGGATGNILDRVRLGYVADFLDLHIGDWRPFLVFNVADAAISLGVVILLLRALLSAEKPKVPRKENADA